LTFKCTIHSHPDVQQHMLVRYYITQERRYAWDSEVSPFLTYSD
jgi:hypothetical protein